MNFSQGHSGTKVQYVNRACFGKEKHQNSQKRAKFMNFSFSPFLWFGLPGRLLRYCDAIPAIPHMARNLLREVSTPPKRCDTPLGT